MTAPGGTSPNAPQRSSAMKRLTTNSASPRGASSRAAASMKRSVSVDSTPKPRWNGGLHSTSSKRSVIAAPQSSATTSPGMPWRAKLARAASTAAALLSVPTTRAAPRRAALAAR